MNNRAKISFFLVSVAIIFIFAFLVMYRLNERRVLEIYYMNDAEVESFLKEDVNLRRVEKGDTRGAMDEIFDICKVFRPKNQSEQKQWVFLFKSKNAEMLSYSSTLYSDPRGWEIITRSYYAKNEPMEVCITPD